MPNAKKLDLLPYPQSVKQTAGAFRLGAGIDVTIDPSCGADALTPALQLTDAIEAVCGFRPRLSRGSGDGIILSVGKGKCPDAYSIEIGKTAINVSGEGESGLYYAVQTMLQIVRQCGTILPCMKISDSPDFAARGFYHDATRGKVPTLETMMALADKLAHYKINQLQLYVEHTFAFKGHADIWEGSDPLTAEEILRLDEYCRKLHIDLVPSLSTFGHFYTVLRSKRREHLNELDIEASTEPYSWIDRQLHHTLNCSDKDSIKLVEEMIDQFAPLFSSRIFNICCDETFDLGKGRNADKMKTLGEGRLYIDFLKKVMKAVRKHKMTPMYWGDIILHNPKLIGELPTDAIALNWDYSPDLSFGKSEPFAKAGVPFYVCPGVTGWNHFLNDIEVASQNIVKFARQGKQLGAIGLLNTDWGDFGHVNLLACSYHGMILGACAAWNVEASADFKEFDASFSRTELGDSTGKAATIMRDFSRAACESYGRVITCVDPSPFWPDREPVTNLPRHIIDSKNSAPAKVLKAYNKLKELEGRLASVAAQSLPQDALSFREILCGARGKSVMHAAFLVMQKAAGKKVPKNGLTYYAVADELRMLEAELSRLWHLRNKPSEYFRIRQALLEMAAKIDGFTKR